VYARASPDTGCHTQVAPLSRSNPALNFCSVPEMMFEVAAERRDTNWSAPAGAEAIKPSSTRLPLPRGFQASDHVRRRGIKRVTNQEQRVKGRRLQIPLKLANVGA
jgi:hypothetical protein